MAAPPSSQPSSLLEVLERKDEAALREAVLRSGCPDDLRQRVWRMVLGLGDAGNDPILRDDPTMDRGSLKMDVDLLVQANSPHISQEEVEPVVVDYCTSRNLPYCTEVTDLLAPIMKVQDITPQGCAAILKAVTQEYTPFLHCPPSSPLGEAEGEAATRTDTYNLMMRLLLQYHDAELCSHLDRNKSGPTIAVGWGNTLFAGLAGTESVLPLWDALLVSQDPLLPSFVSLALFLSHRDPLLATQGEESVTAVLSELTMPSTTSGLMALVQDGLKLKHSTPPSACMTIRKLFSPAAGEAAAVECHDDILKSVVLPVESEELVEAFKKHPNPERRVTHLKFLVLDCRALKSFQFARLPTAVHVGPNVGYEPDKMREMLERFEGARGSHFCLLGTGRGIQAETNLLQVLALRFLSQGFNHVSIAADGFRGVIAFIRAGLIEFVRETPDAAPAPASPPPASPDSHHPAGDQQGSLSSIDTQKLKKQAAEQADKVKKWGMGLLSKWAGSGGGEEPSQQQQQQATSNAAASSSSNAATATTASSSSQSPNERSRAEATEQPQQPSMLGKLGGIWKQSASGEPKRADSPDKKAQKSGAEERAFALMTHSDDESDDFQLITHPKTGQKASVEETPKGGSESLKPALEIIPGSTPPNSPPEPPVAQKAVEKPEGEEQQQQRQEGEEQQQQRQQQQEQQKEEEAQRQQQKEEEAQQQQEKQQAATTSSSTPPPAAPPTDDIFGEPTPEELSNVTPAVPSAAPATSAAPAPTAEAAPAPADKKKEVDIFADDFNIDDIVLSSNAGKPETKTGAGKPVISDDLDDLFS